MVCSLSRSPSMPVARLLGVGIKGDTRANSSFFLFLTSDHQLIFTCLLCSHHIDLSASSTIQHSTCLQHTIVTSLPARCQSAFHTKASNLSRLTLPDTIATLRATVSIPCRHRSDRRVFPPQARDCIQALPVNTAEVTMSQLQAAERRALTCWTT